MKAAGVSCAGYKKDTGAIAVRQQRTCKVNGKSVTIAVFNGTDAQAKQLLKSVMSLGSGYLIYRRNYSLKSMAMARPRCSGTNCTWRFCNPFAVVRWRIASSCALGADSYQRATLWPEILRRASFVSGHSSICSTSATTST
jgi:hypothetical protein